MRKTCKWLRLKGNLQSDIVSSFFYLDGCTSNKTADNLVNDLISDNENPSYIIYAV